MILESISIYILVVVFLATLVRSTFGFGESLVAVPLLALRIPLEIAVPLSVLMSIFVAGVVVAQDWKKIHIRSAGWLIFFTLLGIPLGLLLLVSGDEQIAKAGLGLLIIAFSTYSLFGKKSILLKSDSMLWLSGCGLLAGVFGGAYGLNGPPLVVYGSMRQWSAQHFRATLQGYFLPASLIGMLGYWFQGLWISTVTHYFLISLPAMIPAIFLGRVINHRLKGQEFLNYVYIGLVGIGILLLVQALGE
ncbi:MAG TPA: sulfite exporter TauE/SafE family protein [Cytophagales bacterium]|nr:sulfite exporter TauE/SafE family protein [Cytophagales bacterium]